MARWPTTGWRPAGRVDDTALPVDFACSREHFVDHLAPVWRTMRNRGRFCVPDHLMAHARACGVEPSPMDVLPAARGPVAVAAYVDLRPLAAAGRHLILFEHGAGFTFGVPHVSYAGGLRERARVRLFACTNDWVERANARAIPGCITAVVGCPKLDALIALPAPKNPEPVVAVAFHWDCRVAPETSSAYSHFKSALPALAERFRVIGHAHPRNRSDMREVFDGLGIEFVEGFADVCRRADLYVNDASSTLYEFAALDRPVVVLNAPWYRRGKHLGLRFWDCEDVGVPCDEPGDLVAAVEYALCDPLEQKQLRAMATELVYPYLGTAAQRAAEVLDAFPAVVAGRAIPPPEPLPLPDDCGLVCDDPDAGRWHTVPARGRYMGRLAPGVRITGSLAPAYEALRAGWDVVCVPAPYSYKAQRKPRFMEHDARAVFWDADATDDPFAPGLRTWLLHPSFALELP